MPISRLHLVDASSPETLVKRILQAEPNFSMPVPIPALCARLGIVGIEDVDTDGFKGHLATDAKRSEGTIMAKRGGEPRRRFTIAHELVHFLMAHHVPDQPGWFTSKSPDFLPITAKDDDPGQHREVEADRFAPLILMPPHLLRAAMETFRDPDLQHVLMLAHDSATGKEAARAYVRYRLEQIAILVRLKRCHYSHSLSASIREVGSPISAYIACEIKRRPTVKCWPFLLSSVTYLLEFGRKALVGQ